MVTGRGYKGPEDLGSKIPHEPDGDCETLVKEGDLGEVGRKTVRHLLKEKNVRGRHTESCSVN